MTLTNDPFATEAECQAAIDRDAADLRREVTDLRAELAALRAPREPEDGSSAPTVVPCSILAAHDVDMMLENFQRASENAATAMPEAFNHYNREVTFHRNRLRAKLLSPSLRSLPETVPSPAKDFASMHREMAGRLRAEVQRIYDFRRDDDLCCAIAGEIGLVADYLAAGSRVSSAETPT